MIVQCAQCNSDLQRRPFEIKRSKNHFCNPTCHGLWNSQHKIGINNPIYKQIEVDCGNCKKKFTVPKHKLDDLQKGKVKNLFCEKNCLQQWQSKEYAQKAYRKDCLHCGKEFRPKSKVIKYCSVPCSSANRVVLIDLKCDFCNEGIQRKPSMVRKNNFCSVNCRSNWNSKTKKKQVSVKCTICKNTYIVRNNQKDRTKCCSKKCLNTWKSTVYASSKEGKEHFRKNGLKSTLLQKHSETKPEKVVRSCLETHGIDYEPQKHMYDKFIVDYYIPSQNTVIEVLGDYWHANPRKYGNSENLIPLTPKQQRQIKKDKARKTYLEACGHKVIMIWECDIYANVESTLENII